MKKIKLLSILLVGFLFFSQAQAEEAIIDMHAHYSKTSLEEVLAEMDENSVDYVVYMPAPNVEGNSGGTGKEKIYLDAANSNSRVMAFYGGNKINKEIYHQDASTVTKKMKKAFKNKIKNIILTKNYKGIGELGPRHFSLSDGHPDIEFAADHPYMLVLAKLSAKYQIPLDVHLELNDTTIPQLKNLLAYKSSSIIILDHAGWSNTGLATSKKIKNLMKKYPNLYSSIKFRKPTSTEQKAVRLTDSNGTLKTGWKNLFEKYPDRFVIGTDTKLGLKDTYTMIIPHRNILSQLSEITAQKIRYDNAAKLLKLE